jgi:segregation and condensation protein B
VTTEKFLVEFGFESLRDLPDLDALTDAGLMRPDDQVGAKAARSAAAIAHG